MKQETLQLRLKQARCLCYALLLITIMSVNYIEAQTVEWASAPIGTNPASPYYIANYGKAVAADDSGNVYVTGTITDSTDFGGVADVAMVFGGGSGEAFIAKYNASGSLVWLKALASINSGDGSSGEDIALDALGNVYIIGNYTGEVVFPNADTIFTYSWDDIFFSKYDANGNFIWVKTLSATDGNWNQASIAINDTAMCISGTIVGQMDFDPGIGTANHYSQSMDAFIAKYSLDGNYQWFKVIGGSNADQGKDVAFDRAGNIYTAGHITGTVNFDIGGGGAYMTGNDSLSGSDDGFLAKYNAEGAYQWAMVLGGDGNDLAVNDVTAIALDTSNNVYITGLYSRSIDFDPGPQTAILGSPELYGNMYIAKYNSDGNYDWAHVFNDANNNNMGLKAWGRGIAIDRAGNPVITGNFNHATDFDSGSGTAILNPTTQGNVDIFVAKYDATGSYLWAKSLNGLNQDESNIGYGISTDLSGNTYVTGQFSADTLQFSTNNGNNAIPYLTGSFDNTYTDIFLLKLSCDDTNSSFLNISTCQSSYTLGDSIYTQPGIYTQVLRNVSGCDSTITLNLSFYQLEPIINVNEFVLGTTQPYATYQWILNGEAIPGATNATYTVSENGDYQVAVTNAEGCSDTSAVYTVTNATGLENIPGIAGYIKVYPNPAKDVVYIESPVPVNAMLTAVDGKVIIKANHTKSLSLKGLAEGVYFLQLRDKDNHLLKVEKIVKQQ